MEPNKRETGEDKTDSPYFIAFPYDSDNLISAGASKYDKLRFCRT